MIIDNLFTYHVHNENIIKLSQFIGVSFGG